jgi:MOSC domain-containing protein YiiM
MYSNSMGDRHTKRVLSVNVGLPKEVRVDGRVVLTGIFKSPVEGKVALRGYNLEGDRQADLTAHGGPYKAVYAYPSEHYSHWAAQLPGFDLPPGAFGENLTTESMDEETVHIGDRFRIGSAIVQVAQPRMPCFKLGIRFGRPEMVKEFWNSNRPGIYFSVVTEGELQRGDTIHQVDEGPERVSVADIVRLYKGEIFDRELIDRALKSPLHGSWKTGIRSWIEEFPEQYG